jgi:DNA-binding Xre family transcriptional regulator
MAKLALDRALKRRKISKRRFAKMLEMDYHNVFKLFRAGTNPTLMTLNKWAALLKCRVRDLLDE